MQCVLRSVVGYKCLLCLLSDACSCPTPLPIPLPLQTLLVAGLPLMVGWFSLNVPAGLSLYYFCNSAFTSAQQVRDYRGRVGEEFRAAPSACVSSHASTSTPLLKRLPLQIYFRKLGGVVVDTPDLGPVKQLGMGRRTGQPVALALPAAAAEAGNGAEMSASEQVLATAQSAAQSGNGAGVPGEPDAEESLRCKRKKRELLQEA